jgi:hypothetical protein
MGTIQARITLHVRVEVRRTPIVLFAIVVAMAILAAFFTTLERLDTRAANNESPPVMTGLAKPHAPLDRAPGRPVLGN